MNTTTFNLNQLAKQPKAVAVKRPTARKTAPVTAKRSRKLDPAIWDRLSSYEWNFEAMNAG